MVLVLTSKKTWFSAKQQDNFWLQILHYLGESSVNIPRGFKKFWAGPRDVFNPILLRTKTIVF